MYWGKDKNITFFYLFHICFIIRAKIRFYFETNKKNHKKLRKKTVQQVNVIQLFVEARDRDKAVYINIC